MSFANQRNTLINDGKGNIYNFRWNQDKITLISYDKKQQKFDTITLVEDAAMEFDAVIDENDCIYFVCQKKDNHLLLMSMENGAWNTNNLGGTNGLNLFNLNILVYGGKIHIIYCVPSMESDMTYRIYHHYYDKEKWATLQVKDICRKNLLNPFQLIKNRGKLLIGFYDLIGQQEQIFIKEFDGEKDRWKESVQLTSSGFDKLYIDMLMTTDEILHLTYSEYQEGNLLIKYEKYKIGENKPIKILDNILSNPGNCTYPTFVMEHGKLWNVWTEYDQVVSSFSTDEGLTWSLPYLWKESKENRFLRYKFWANDIQINNFYLLNYTFGRDYPEFSFVGFGPLDKALEIPLKVKKNQKREVEEIVDYKEVNKKVSIDNNTERYGDNVKKIEEDLKKLEERIESIEEFINRRRRGSLFNSRK